MPNQEVSSTPVIIAGAGPVGLALALGLAQHGVRSVVLEQKQTLDPHSRALGILPRTLEIFHGWGMLQRFLDEGSFLSRADIWIVGRAGPQATIDFSSLARLTTVPGVVIMPQDRTEALLLEEVRQRGLTEVLFAHEVSRFRQDPSGVTVEVTRAGRESRTLRGQFLAGCDGARSAVRGQLGWSLQGKTYPTRMLLADVRLPPELDQLSWPRAAPEPRGVLAALRYRTRLWRIIATLDADETEETALSQAGLSRKVQLLFGPVAWEPVWSSVFHIHCRTSPHFRQGRVVLAGDAAHLNSPAGGQGMNSGIQDAHNLAWKLGRALDGGSVETLLGSYEIERRAAVVGNVDRYTDLLTRFVLLPGPPLRPVLLRLMRLAIARPAIMSQIAVRAGMLDVRYRKSPLISGEGSRLGARAPDGELTSSNGVKTRLLDLANEQAVLLLFDDGHLPGWSPERLAALLASVPKLRIIRLMSPSTALPDGRGSVGEALHDTSGRIWNAWAATGDLAALIRPDDHVGWMARRPTPEALAVGVQRALGLD